MDRNFNFLTIDFDVQSWTVTACVEKYGDNNMRPAAEERGRRPIRLVSKQSVQECSLVTVIDFQGTISVCC